MHVPVTVSWVVISRAPFPYKGSVPSPFSVCTRLSRERAVEHVVLTLKNATSRMAKEINAWTSVHSPKIIVPPRR